MQRIGGERKYNGFQPQPNNATRLNGGSYTNQYGDTTSKGLDMTQGPFDSPVFESQGPIIPKVENLEYSNPLPKNIGKPSNNIRDLLTDYCFMENVTETLRTLYPGCGKWKDTEFDPINDRSLVLEGMAPSSVLMQNSNYLSLTRFLHPNEIYPNEPYTVFKGVNPTDLNQGALGNCYLVSSIAALAEYPKLIHRLFDIDYVNEFGLYVIWINVAGIWKQIILDELLPAAKTDSGILQIFTHTNDAEIWVSLLEKAYAKAFKGYANIIGGLPASALRDLTGAPCKTIPLSSHISQSMLDQAWEELRMADGKGYLMCASSLPHTSSTQHLSDYNGLVFGHAYTIIRTFAGFCLDNGVEKEVRLVQLRNPYGRKEWQGEWRDNDSKWATVKSNDGNSPQVKDDGIFWMSIEDLAESFRSVAVCLIRANDKYNVLLIPPAKRTCIKFTITHKGQYTFSVVQKPFRLYPAEQRIQGSLMISPVRLLIGRLNEDGSCQYIGDTYEVNETVFIDETFQPGNYVGFAQPFNEEFNSNCSFTAYGPECVGLEICELNEEMDRNMNYAIWKSFAKDNISNFYEDQEGVKVYRSGAHKAEILLIQNYTAEIQEYRVIDRSPSPARELISTYSSDYSNYLIAEPGDIGVVVSLTIPGKGLVSQDSPYLEQISPLHSTVHISNAITYLNQTPALPPTRERALQYEQELKRLGIDGEIDYEVFGGNKDIGMWRFDYGLAKDLTTKVLSLETEMISWAFTK